MIVDGDWFRLHPTIVWNNFTARSPSSGPKLAQAMAGHAVCYDKDLGTYTSWVTIERPWQMRQIEVVHVSQFYFQLASRKCQDWWIMQLLDSAVNTQLHCTWNILGCEGSCNDVGLTFKTCQWRLHWNPLFVALKNTTNDDTIVPQFAEPLESKDSAR